jgi:hypothetical protein
MSIEKLRQAAFRTISQTGIRYRSSRLSEALPGLPEDAPSAGDRFPWLRLRFSAGGAIEDLYGKLDDTRFTLIVIGQPALPDREPGLDGLLHTHVIPADSDNDRELARARIPRPAFYLIRPDGHVGLSGTRFDAGAVTRYLSGRLNLKITAP